MITQTFRVSGMTCGNCVRHVTQALDALPGVEEAQVDLASGSATVTGTVDPAAVVAALTREGYPAEPVTGQSAGAASARRGCCCG